MEISNETFARIIKLTASGVNWEEFGIKVATQFPEVFMEIMDDSNWEEYAHSMFEAECAKIDIIKFVRNESGMSLKEAKDWVHENVLPKEE